MTPLQPTRRRIGVIALCAFAAVCLILASVELGYALQGSGGAWVALIVLVAATITAFIIARRLYKPARSGAAATGHIVLFEYPMLGPVQSDTPALTLRGPRDAIERFIPIAEFEPLFGGYALWHTADRPIDELPGEALGVWGRRVCQRFRQTLRERGATVEVRSEPGPKQRFARLVRASSLPSKSESASSRNAV